MLRYLVAIESNVFSDLRTDDVTMVFYFVLNCHDYTLRWRGIMQHKNNNNHPHLGFGKDV